MIAPVPRQFAAPPETIPVDGGVTITYRVTAVCSGGQWLNDSQLSVPFRVDDYDYASGYFDFLKNKSKLVHWAIVTVPLLPATATLATVPLLLARIAVPGHGLLCGQGRCTSACTSC